MASSSSSTKLSLKLMIDKKLQKVVFAFASKPAVDFICNLLCLPIGDVVRLLTKNEMVGSLGNLYESVEKLKKEYMQPNQNNDVLLKPRAVICSSETSVLLPANDVTVAADKLKSLKLYTCPSHFSHVTGEYNSSCPQSRFSFSHGNCVMNKELAFVGNNAVLEEEFFTNKNWFVKEEATYVVMDDLEIKSMLNTSILSLLKKSKVKEIGLFDEKVVQLGKEEGINLLKASLQSKTVLTSVFLMKKVETK